MKIVLSLIGLLYATLCFSAQSIIQITDATGQFVSLPKKVTRVVSLAPNITELIFSAGGGEKIIGTVSASNYPPQAENIPIIGSFKNINLEALIKQQPDIVFAWYNNQNYKTANKLKKLGLTVFMVETNTLSKIPNTIEILGKIFNTQKIANQQATKFRQTLLSLKPALSKNHPSVFIQIWHKPLISLNQKTIFSEIVQFCGGRNIFADHPLIAPQVNIETVLQKKPHYIFVANQNNLSFWQNWKTLPAVQKQAIYHINPDYTNRATMRTLFAVEKICKILNKR